MSQTMKQQQDEIARLSKGNNAVHQQQQEAIERLVAEKAEQSQKILDQGDLLAVQKQHIMDKDDLLAEKEQRLMIIQETNTNSLKSKLTDKLAHVARLQNSLEAKHAEYVAKCEALDVDRYTIHILQA